MKKYVIYIISAILIFGTLINIVFLFSEFKDNISTISAYDYRIAIFGNNGVYPEEAVTYAQNIAGEIPNVTIEAVPIKFDTEESFIMCIALDDNTFKNLYSKSIDTQKPYGVISSLYSTDLSDMESINVKIQNIDVEILGISNAEIPLGAMSNITIPPREVCTTLVLITTQDVANHLYEISSQSTQKHQRQISVYYQTKDGKSLTKQMEKYSAKNINDVQVWDNQDYSDNSLWYFSKFIKRFGFIACLIVLMLLVAYKKSVQKRKMEQDNAMLKQQVKFSMENVESLMDNCSEQRKITHDFNNHLSTINSLLSSGNIEKAKEYVDSISNKNLGKSILFNSNNSVIDVLLTQKYNNAKQNGINMQVAIDDLSQLPMKDEDVVVVLSNMLDNAIDAAKQCTVEKTIKIKFVKDNNGYILSVHNTSNNNFALNGNEIVTTKEDKLSHGYGLKNIKTVLEKYGYDYAISSKEGKVSFTVLMQN